MRKKKRHSSAWITLTRKSAQIVQRRLALLPQHLRFLSFGPKSVVLVVQLHDMRDHLLDVNVLWDFGGIKVLCLKTSLELLR